MARIMDNHREFKKVFTFSNDDLVCKKQPGIRASSSLVPDGKLLMEAPKYVYDEHQRNQEVVGNCPTR